MLVRNDSHDGAVPPDIPTAGDFAPTIANSECQALVKLARAHFGVATSLVTILTPLGQRLKAVDGVLPDALPPDLTGLSSQGKRLVPAVIDDG
jgi:hypothetical protein